LSTPTVDQGAMQKSDGCLVFSVGVTGHRDCDPASAPHVRERLVAELGRLKGIFIGDRPGQCLVSDGFETRIGRADKPKPTQSKKFAIHTLGHERAFSVALDRVWNAPISRHSRPSVGNAAIGSRSHGGR